MSLVPSFVLEIASLPLWCDDDVCFFLFLSDPVVEDLLSFLVFDECFEEVVVVVDVGFVWLVAFDESYDSDCFFSFSFVDHCEGFGDLSFLEVLDGFGYFGRYL